MQVRGPKSGFRNTITVRRELRRNMSPAEKLFWSKVANRQFLNLKFRKQHGVGPYVVDFYCPSVQLITEIDGDTHFGKENEARDAKRTEYLMSLGYRIIRYNNLDVLNNIDGVFQDLENKIKPL